MSGEMDREQFAPSSGFKSGKDLDYFQFTRKVLSLPQSPASSVKCFPANIEHLLLYYLRLCCFACVYPVNYVFNSERLQYEIRGRVAQKALYLLIWFMIVSTFLFNFVGFCVTTKPGDPTGALLLLGGWGHITALAIYVFFTNLYKDELCSLLNFLQLLEAQTEQAGKRRRTFFTYRTLSIALWLFSTAYGMNCILQRMNIGGGPKRIESMKESTLFRIVDAILPSAASRLVDPHDNSLILFILASVAEFFVRFYEACTSLLIFGLEIVIVVTMKCVTWNLTRTLTSREYWKPSERDVISRIIMVRQMFGKLNKIFGYIVFFTAMGEFPNYTFFVVFLYKDRNNFDTMQQINAFGVVTQLLVLIISSSALHDVHSRDQITN